MWNHVKKRWRDIVRGVYTPQIQRISINKYLGNLGDSLGGSSDKDELQVHAKMIRIQKYLEAKAATTALNAL